MLEQMMIVFKSLPTIVYVVMGFNIIVFMLFKIIEDREYYMTYKNLPSFMRPTKSWWRENKDYARRMSDR